MSCSVARCLEVVGEWWNFLIVRDAMLGVTRFEQFQERLGISRNILTQRLGGLVEDGIFERVRYQERPDRFEYRLTEKGRDLWAVLDAMRTWGDKWDAPLGSPVEMLHTKCGHPTRGVPACAHCKEPLRPEELRIRPGPGATADTPLPVRSR